MSVAILYFSGYGHTDTQAKAIAKGVESASDTAELIRINDNGEITEAQWEILDASSAIIFGSPTYMGTVAWQFKKVMDSSSKPWFTQSWKDKIAGGFTCSAGTNGNKETTLQTIFTVAQQHSMIWVGTGVMPASSKNNTPEDENWTATFTGAMAIARAEANPDELPAGDIKLAHSYGKRISELAQRLEG